VCVAIPFTRPTLDAREQPLDSWAITLNSVFGAIDVSQRKILTCPIVAALYQQGHQVFRAREDKQRSTNLSIEKTRPSLSKYRPPIDDG
jgi:hypothetical protein